MYKCTCRVTDSIGGVGVKVYRGTSVQGYNGVGQCTGCK